MVLWVKSTCALVYTSCTYTKMCIPTKCLLRSQTEEKVVLFVCVVRPESKNQEPVLSFIIM